MLLSGSLSHPACASLLQVCRLLKQKAGHFERYRPSPSTAQGSGKSNLHFNTGASMWSGEERSLSLAPGLPEGRTLCNRFWHPLNREASPHSSLLTDKLDLLSQSHSYRPLCFVIIPWAEYTVNSKIKVVLCYQHRCWKVRILPSTSASSECLKTEICFLLDCLKK